MNAVDTLQRLARGERPRDGLLPPCRLEGLGTHAFGEEAVVNHFRTVPFAGLEAAETVASPGHVGIFAGEAALIADCYAGSLLRIWRLGAGEPLPAEPAIGVAFDTDLYQARRDMALRWEDHPELDGAAHETVRDIGYRIAHGHEADADAPDWRVRPFLLRAFSGEGAGAALFAVHRLGPGEVRSAGFSFMAARFDLAAERQREPQIVRDRAGERAVAQAPWRTRFP